LKQKTITKGGMVEKNVKNYWSTDQWRSHLENFLGGKMFDTRRITLFSLQKSLSKHKTTIISKNLGGMAPLPPWARLCCRLKKGVVTEHSLVAKGGSSKWVQRGDFSNIWQSSLITGSLL